MADDKFWEPTIKLYTGFIKKPSMSEKLLAKPPFKYLFDIILATMDATGFGQGLYTDQEKDANYYENRDLKILFLRKVIDLIQYTNKSSLQAKPNKIVAGLEPEHTNSFLCELHRVATTPELCQKGNSIVKKLLAKIEKETQGGGDAGEKPAEKGGEEPQKKPEKKPQQEPPAEQPKPKREDPPSQPKVERSNSKGVGGQVDEPVPVNRQNMRPSSAAKAPPKIANNVKVADTQSKGKGTTGVIVDRGDKDEDDQNEAEQADNRGSQPENAGGKGVSKFTNQALNDNLGIVPSAQKDQGGEEGDNQGGIKFKRKIGNQKPTIGGSTTATAGGTTAVLQGASSGADISALTQMVQEIAKNVNPLGKSLEFIADDIESMNHELDYWTKQYKQYKEKMQNELKVTDEMLQPIQDQIAEIEEKISDKRNKISNVKAQLIKNQSQIQTLLYSVVSTK
ncbi:microtubule-binding protein MIP-T3 (macronuclear) [Tetrahymena thermophila SB210]|uniref:Microtubule-binding protein MIP-T3 n=1 Tax=Tetrahymena thermophila (strain SB210) TaxID=312017 RepID=Q24FQ8_TETTS|nr:microtubule-binding protein MIP-T3 [Tetrahymena thermophila SB210]EAS06586.1 microtubule-binding protein MIP-T3 [Tetrahymena thermophila SB210]|eukprot:XP_001026831.1 microtubule-binding protein MIP-T3 [Tetrahymena thermophila SB210]